MIDNPTTLPFWVKNAAQYLKGNTKHYMFISTTSVYRDQSEIGINENSPTVPMPDGLDPYQPDQRNMAQLAASNNPSNYGAFKRAPKWKCRISCPRRSRCCATLPARSRTPTSTASSIATSNRRTSS